MTFKKKPYYTLKRRPSLQPNQAIPINARSAARVCFEPNTKECDHVSPYAKFMWSVNGTGRVGFNDIETTLSPGHFALFLEDELHIGHSLNESWEVCWVTFDGPQCNQILKQFNFHSAGVYEAGPAPLSHIIQLQNAITDVTPNGQRDAGALVYQLISLACNQRENPHTDELIEQSKNMIKEKLTHYELSVNYLADTLEINRFTFTRRFQQAQQMSPMQYINHLRIQRALSLLAETRKPISEIAKLCGYDDQSYFARLVKKICGLKPSELRGT